jgi:hypothetical protein
VKSIPVILNGLLHSVRNLGKSDVAAVPYGFALNTLQRLQRLITFFTFDLSLGIHHFSLMADIVFATPK